MTDDWEIEIDEFQDLKKEKDDATKKEYEILEFIGPEKAKATPKIRDELEVEHTTAYSRLQRLQEKGYLEKRYRGKRCYWALSDQGKMILGD